MTTLAPPADLSRNERTAFRRLIRTLRERGIDPVARAALIADFVRAEARLVTLRADEATAEGGARLQLARSVNVASAERRRLHRQLFVGARKAKPLATVEERKAAASESEADAAWRAILHGGQASLPGFESRVAATEARFGSPSWNALLYDSLKAQREGERAIRRNTRGEPEEDAPADA